MLVNLLACVAPAGPVPTPAHEVSVQADPLTLSSEFEEIRAQRLEVPIVIGAGPSGLAVAQDLGRAVVFEAADVPGGRARWAGGFLFMVGTEEQAAAGVEDSVALAAEQWEGLTGAPPSEATLAWLEASDAVRDRLVEMGVSLSLSRLDPVYGADRQHAPEGGGQALVDALLAAEPDGVEIRTSTPVQGLVLRDGRAAGVLTDAGWIESDTVVIAAGGFADRADLVAMSTGWEAGGWRLGEATTATGAAIDWASEWGLGTESLGAVGAYRDVLGLPGEDGQAIEVSIGGVVPWLWIDASGERFVDESATWSLALAGLASAHDNVWALTTWELLLGMVEVEDQPYLVEGDALRCADTWTELADALEVDPAGVDQTMADLLAVVTGGEDPLGRSAGTFIPHA